MYDPAKIIDQYEHNEGGPDSMTKLPSDAEMTRLFVLGQLNNREIAEMYEVTPQAVNKRFQKLGLERRPFANDANAEIAKVWKVEATQEAGSHHAMFPIQSLRLWLRLRLGDRELSDRQRRDAMNFEKRVREKNVVLAYDQTKDKPFSWEPRTPRDDRLVVRYPESKGKPPLAELSRFRLPDVPVE
ncbi:hypothetical protein [Streptomyces sp. IBSBF 2950]|uniref:hypothetical protein n=1 Tax=Streptomyces sp. IBSBF 2950 TaxID=2903528 RepID=UPI002FDBE35D